MPHRVGRSWSLKPVDLSLAERLKEALGVRPRVARLLAIRGVTGAKEAEEFLSPGWKGLHDPFLVPGMQDACELVHQAIAAGEVITLYGDYDVDGTCATAVLWWVFKKLKAKVRYHVPDRRDGYGLTMVGLEATRAAGSTFVITMDQGISAVEEVARAREMGIRVLVTDHHTPPEVLPDAVAILHPSLREGYPNPHLCGAGVAFKFGEALLRSAPNQALRDSSRSYVENCVDLAALATIADVCPLRGENRILVSLGLEQLGRSRHPGLAAMLAESRSSTGKPTAQDVGFGIGPMMNASGRLAGPDLTLECLLTRKPAEARKLTQQLAALNQERRTLTEELLEMALAQRELWQDEKIGVLALESEQVGIVGLVAGRLREMFWKPFVVCAHKDGELVGSCRSVPGFHIKQALDGVSEELLRYGGHAQAAGFSLRPDHFDGFAGKLRHGVQEGMSEDLLIPRLEVDEELSLEDLGWDLIEDVQQLAPFGAGNPAPNFSLNGCGVQQLRVMGNKGRHIRMMGRDFPTHLDVVGFHLRGVADRAIEGGGLVDLAFQVSVNEWRGRRRLQMRLEDLRVSR
jgi:single-stranded-DNA-specific exonuclease